MPEHYQLHCGSMADNGIYAAVPAGLTLDLMKSACPLANDGRKVGETHILVYVPRTIGSAPFSMATMVDKDARLFWSTNDYGSDMIKSAPISESAWMLIPRLDLPGSGGKTLGKQEQILSQFRTSNRSYEVVEALPLVTALVMEALGHNQKSFVEFWARTGTAPSPSSRVVVGLFGARGMYINNGINYTNSLRGLALFRNLKI